jgi:TonB-dependent SusC/RagA subfamily outer membrane receptor
MINGKVTAFKDLPLANVELKVKKSKDIVLTNADGTFEIECQINDKIYVRASGFRSAWIKVKDFDQYEKVNLEFGGSDRDIINAAKAGHMEEEKLTNAFEAMQAEEYSNAGYTSVVQIVKRKFPEVSVINGEFQMRGIRSLSGSNAALIVINGSVSNMGTLENIAVQDVKTVKLLKGPSAAIWGSQGSNGVVLVTTK